ncbi:MAG: tartrate-resistant acid phosphatase type 5 family protein [Acetobacteraceae bacterium]|nr:tartrate-resistant acid phosphatase type 5 family protein [Acetobacteraceae bacterium]
MSNLLMSRRNVVLGAGGTLLLPCAVPAAPRAASLPLVVLGDWGERGSPIQRAVADAMGRSAAAIGSRLVISVGDNFYEDGVTSIADSQWHSSFEAIYTAPSLQTRWDVILGNHDYRGSVQAQLDYARLSKRWTMPGRVFIRSEMLTDGTQIDFFYIDTSPMLSMYRGTKVRIDDQNVPAQLAWLDAVLGRSQAKWKIVVGHHPIHTSAGGKRDQAELIQHVKPLLLRHGVQLYINGHDHNLQKISRDGICFLTCGGGGAALGKVKEAAPGQFAAKSHGFMTMEISAGRIAYRFIDEAGTALYADQVTA